MDEERPLITLGSEYERLMRIINLFLSKSAYIVGTMSSVPFIEIHNNLSKKFNACAQIYTLDKAKDYLCIILYKKSGNACITSPFQFDVLFIQEEELDFLFMPWHNDGKLGQLEFKSYSQDGKEIPLEDYMSRSSLDVFFISRRTNSFSYTSLKRGHQNLVQLKENVKKMSL